MTEPQYHFVKGEGWVINAGVEILLEERGLIVVDMADVPVGVFRSYAPWHPEYEISDNDGRGIQEALQRGLTNGTDFEVKFAQTQRKQYVCAVRAEDYHKLVRND